MPKFNGQNKKRIDPRYFLNETTSRDLDESAERIGLDASFENLRSGLLDMTDKPLEDNQREIVDTLLKQLDKYKCGRVQVDQSVPSLNPQDIEQLASLAGNNLPRFFQIADEMQKADNPSAFSDTDGDGSSDKEELMQIAKNLK
tara:strand:- start:181 stop:612 length:432 start_codon:yes stop_codon:yes gene_type:complete